MTVVLIFEIYLGCSKVHSIELVFVDVAYM